MAYRILAYTFDNPIKPVSQVPFGPGIDISFADAKETVVYFDTQSHLFQQVSHAFPYGQTLLIDSDFGNVTLPEGTNLVFQRGGVARMEDPATGNRYFIMYAFHTQPQLTALVDFSGRRTVFVIPSPGAPPFDPTKLYKINYKPDVFEFKMAHVDIPPSYLATSCFTAGTLIETASGPRRVETLVPGDLVLTRDRGLRPLSWVGQRFLTPRHLEISPRLHPIRIRAGALGPGQPARDLFVSPQHRVLIRSDIAARVAGSQEVLVAAIHLGRMQGVDVYHAPIGVSYHHFLFDRHEVVLSNGCWTESMFTGAQALKSVSPTARREIHALFPELGEIGNPAMTGARPFLSGREAREMARTHMQEASPLIRDDARIRAHIRA